MLLKNDTQILRVLQNQGDKSLVIDCIRKTMPKWIDSAALSTFTECSEAALYEQTQYPENRELTQDEQRIAQEHFTMIAGVLPFIGNEQKRSQMIDFLADQQSKQTIRKYLCLYLVYQDIAALAPQPKTEKELTQDEKNMRWALNKFFYTKNKNSLMTAYTLMLKEKYCDQQGQLVAAYPTFDQFRYFYRKTKKMQKYYIEEVKQDKGGITYDNTLFYITVKVTDNQQGSLVAETTVITNKSATPVDSITFANTYKAEAAKVALEGTKTYDKPLKGDDFTFVLKGKTDTKDIDEKKSNDKDGKIVFSELVFEKAGTYNFTVEELNTALGFIEYSTVVYEVKVVVTDNNAGKLIATVKIVATAKIAGGEAIVFTNKYEVETAKVNLSGTKTYDKPLKGNDFTFILEGEIDGQRVKQEKKNDAAGNITFGELSFTKEGTYNFTIKEQAEAFGFIEYSTVVYEVKVVVTDNNAGKLIDTVTVNDKSDGKSHLIFYPEDRPVMLETLKMTKKPVVAFKIFAGGQMFLGKTQEEKRQLIKNAYQEVFSSLKPDDLAAIGVFQRDSDQLRENMDLYNQWYEERQA